MSNWIKGAIKHPGSFSKAAAEHSESTAEYAKNVLKDGSKASEHTKRQAALAETLSKLRTHKSKIKKLSAKK